ncbi:MAG: hypothetical protein EXS17_08060 [Phycisphaerales bacterium]|nr:hypothetical protein [Phycisphaerales bacterium]
MSALPEIDFRNSAAMVDVFQRAAETMHASPLRRGSIVHLPSRGRLLATGDVHDFPGHLAAIIQLAGLDESPNHHVMLHELIHGERLINGMDISYRNLAIVAELVNRYPLQVHPLLANHELAQCFRISVSKGGGDQVAMFDDGLDYVFGDSAEEVATAIREFVLAMPLALRAENGLWTSHSVPNRLDFDATAFARILTSDDYASPSGTAWCFVWGRLQNPQHIAALLKICESKLFIVGHCQAEMGIESPAPGLVVINSDHERGVVVYIDLESPLPPTDELVRSAIPLGLYRVFEE